MLKGLVIAGNYEQYKDYIKDMGFDNNEYRYISDPDSWRGIHNIKVHRIGIYYENPAYESISREVDEDWILR